MLYKGQFICPFFIAWRLFKKGFLGFSLCVEQNDPVHCVSTRLKKAVPK
ncbi:hypothetical protein ALT1644_220013 [Alteromonas macleodii]